MFEGYRLFTNSDRTVLVRLWPEGAAEVCTREEEAAIWGPPVPLLEERVSVPPDGSSTDG